MAVKDLTGQRFGRLTVIKRGENGKGYRAMWLCKCDCGTEKVISGKDLRSNKTKSCGCLQKENTQVAALKHGKSNIRLYKVWHSIKQRCNNTHDKAYKYYGGRGIKMCPEWERDFQTFYDWAMLNGYNPNAQRGECTIERIDVNGNYTPTNCKWATMLEQVKNTRKNINITYKGKTQCISAWAKELNIKPTTLRERLKKGWDIEKAFTTTARITRKK